MNKYATSIYKRHFPKHLELGDVTKIRTKDLPRFELLVGGFPCQAFSIAGKRMGFNDTRGTLFFEIARILKDKKPKYFLLENVKGLLSHNKGSTFQTILKVLDELGYNVEWKVLNSKNYGVPQNRERVYIKGYFREECGGEVLSFRGESEEVNGVGVNGYRDSFRTYSIYDDVDTITRTLTGDGQNSGNRQLIKVNNAKSQSNRVYSVDGLCKTLTGEFGGGAETSGLYDVTDYDSQIKHNVVEVSDNEVATTTKNGDFFAVTTRQRGLPLKDSTGTLLCGDGCDWGVSNGYRIRRLTPLECERLQGFPDNWTKYGVNSDGECVKISDTQRYKCCGNAVTTNVITSIFNNWNLK